MLTEAKAKSASCPADMKRTRLADGGGLYLEVSPASKRWFWKYRYAGAEKRLALGAYPDVTIRDARDARDDARRVLRDGSDPAQKRQDDKAAKRFALGTTFEAVARQWHEHWKSTQTERHANYVIRRLEKDAFPELGHLPIADINAPRILAMVKKIEARGAGHLPKRVLQSCSQVFRFAIAHGAAERNPATDFNPGDVLKKVATKNQARLDEKDMPELLRKIETYPGSPYTRLALKLMALTFLRTAEMIGARWEEFEGLDGPAPLWRVPAARMKNKKGQPRADHLVPLAPQAVQVLACLHELRTEGPFVFPGERKGATMSNNTLLFALYRMGYKGRMTGHGFRGVASTALYEMGWTRDVVEPQLDHSKSDQVEAAYNHAKHLAARRKLMCAWADHIDVLRNNSKVIVGAFGAAA